MSSLGGPLVVLSAERCDSNATPHAKGFTIEEVEAITKWCNIDRWSYPSTRRTTSYVLAGKRAVWHSSFTSDIMILYRDDVCGIKISEKDLSNRTEGTSTLMLTFANPTGAIILVCNSLPELGAADLHKVLTQCMQYDWLPTAQCVIVGGTSENNILSIQQQVDTVACLLYTSPSPRDRG